MFKMFALLCVLSSADCRLMHEDPPRLFETRADCEAASVIKFQETQMIMQGTQYHSLDVGCEFADPI